MSRCAQMGHRANRGYGQGRLLQWDTRGGIGLLLGFALHTCGNAVRRKVVDIDNDRREVQFLTVLKMRWFLSMQWQR